MRLPEIRPFTGRRKGDFAELIARVDAMSQAEMHEMGIQAKRRIRESYNWEDIVRKYETLFLKHDAEDI